ncbi:MAG: 4-(cytidine 5'-diphospho)-2-C-methyl-D-erythritol kinase [Planctomycetota bacterium]
MVAVKTGDTIERDAPAKINLWLEVLGQRPDGYHNLETVMQTVDFSDVLSFRSRSDGAIHLYGEAAGLPPAEENLVVRAARALKERTGTAMGADIQLTKNIPIGAGLGGGSSDCASTLLALRDLWDLDIGLKPLHEIAR